MPHYLCSRRATAMLAVAVLLLSLTFAISTTGVLSASLLEPTATSVGLSASHDTRVQAGNAATNFDGQELWVGHPNALHVFVNFDLSELPANATVEAAALQLTFTNVFTGSNQVEIGLVNGAWDESTLTWSTQPTITWGGPIQMVDGPGPVRWNVTLAVQDWLDGDRPPYGFALRGDRATRKAIHSSETGAESEQPQLLIRYSTPSEAGAYPDLGDAPDSSNHLGLTNTAYPGVNGNFPTVWSNTPPNQPAGPRHENPTRQAILGEHLSRENEADRGPDQDNQNNILDGDADNANNDRGDDGWRNRNAAFDHCTPTTLIIRVHKAVTTTLNKMYLNVWFDGTRDGDWDDWQPCTPEPENDSPDTRGFEWIVQDFVIDLTAIPAGEVADIPVNTTAVLNLTPDQTHWLRFTLSEGRAPKAMSDPADGRGPHPNDLLATYQFGETEDILQRPQPAGQTGVLTVQKRVIIPGAEPVAAGSVVTYEILLRHEGGNQPIQARLRDELPAGLRLIRQMIGEEARAVLVESPTGGATPLHARVDRHPAEELPAPRVTIGWRGSLAPNSAIQLTFLAQQAGLCPPNQTVRSVTNRVQVLAKEAPADFSAEATFAAACATHQADKVEVTLHQSATLGLPGILNDFGDLPLQVRLHNRHATSVTVALLHQVVGEGLTASAANPPHLLDRINLEANQTTISDFALHITPPISDELRLPDDYTVGSQLIYCLLVDDDDQHCPDRLDYPAWWGSTLPFTYTVRPNDLGDAPDSSNHHTGISMTAYTNVEAHFPTTFDPATGLPPGPRHSYPRLFHLGQRVSQEAEADVGADQDPTNNLRPAADQADQDRFDDGAQPQQWSLNHCQNTTLPVQLAISPQAVNWFQQEGRPAYLNIWIDSNRDGDWGDSLNCAANQPAVEHIVIDYPLDVSTLSPGLQNINTPTGLVPWPVPLAERPSWVRITLSERPANKTLQTDSLTYGDGRGYSQPFHVGETEDYRLTPGAGGVNGPDLAVDLVGSVVQQVVQTNDSLVQMAAVVERGQVRFKSEVSNRGGQVASQGVLTLRKPPQLRDQEIVLLQAPGVPPEKITKSADEIKIQLPDLEPNGIIAILIGLALEPGGQGAAIQTGRPYTASVQVALTGDRDESNNRAVATASPSAAAPMLGAVINDEPFWGIRDTTCRTTLNVAVRGRPGSMVNLLADGKLVTTQLMPEEPIYYGFEQLKPGAHQLQVRYTEGMAASALLEVTPRNTNLGPAAGRIKVDPTLAIDPLSITFTNSQRRILHPPTLDWASGQIQGGALLQRGQRYTVGLARCNHDPNLQIELFVGDQLATTLLDADGDGYYTGDFTLAPSLQAADAQASIELRFVVTTGGVEEATSATVETPTPGVVRDASTGQPLANARVAALVSQDAANRAFALLPASVSVANPQITNANGAYSFTLASGLYRLDFVLTGYQPYRTNDIVVDDGALAQDVVLSPVIDEPANHTIHLTANGIEPSLIIVHPGEVVRWVNQDLGDHSVVRSGGWDSGVVAAGQTYTIKAPGKGIYIYTDQTGALGAATILVDDAPPVSPVKRLYLPLVRR